ncbi:hypothetical protein HU200_021854 [Digitaria exilis]|uniref:Uncharacterized protein n=1 Tax=Digitaria exilis TaxID=1010633 RepID=A0A835KBM5_9POAL|nr:hypothetical protein HU200_021854 [Digitaria exilis]CAB3494787.1 unnamed protein product [Digitaria exilis]
MEVEGSCGMDVRCIYPLLLALGLHRLGLVASVSISLVRRSGPYPSSAATVSASVRSLMGISGEDLSAAVKMGYDIFTPTGLDFILVTLLGTLCFPRFDDCIDGGRSPALIVGCLEQEGVFCGWFSADDGFLAAFLSVGARIHREHFCAGCVQDVGSCAELATTDMVVGGWGIILSLQSGSDDLVVVCDYFVRFVLHLLVFWSWCSLIPLAGLLLVDWVLPVKRPVTEPGEWDCPGRSMAKWHAFGMLLTGFEDLFVNSGSGREFHHAFFIAGDGEDLACGNDGRQRRGSLGALDVVFYVIFPLIMSALFKGIDVTVM